MRALIKYQTRKYFCFAFVFDSLMADQQTQNTAIVEEQQVPPTDEVEEGPGSKVESTVPPVAKSSTLELTESPEVVAAMAVDLTTAKTEFDALAGAISESATKLENVDGQEGTSQLIKVMLLGLKAQRSISQIGSIEMKQVAVKQLDLLRHVAAGFSDQTEILQTLSDDIGANLNGLAQSFVKLSDVIKEGYKQSKDGGTDTENRHRQMLEKLDSQNTSVDLAALADEITKAVKSLEGMMGTKRPAEGPPQAVPVEPKRVKYQHPETKEEFEGTEAERDQQMASWWAGIAAKSGSAPSNPGQPMPPPGLAPPSGTPMTPVSGDGTMPIPGYGFPPYPPKAYYYGPPPPMSNPAGMTAPHMPAATGPTP